MSADTVPSEPPSAPTVSPTAGEQGRLEECRSSQAAATRSPSPGTPPRSSKNSGAVFSDDSFVRLRQHRRHRIVHTCSLLCIGRHMGSPRETYCRTPAFSRSVRSPYHTPRRRRSTCGGARRALSSRSRCTTAQTGLQVICVLLLNLTAFRTWCAAASIARQREKQQTTRQWGGGHQKRRRAGSRDWFWCLAKGAASKCVRFEGGGREWAVSLSGYSHVCANDSRAPQTVVSL